MRGSRFGLRAWLILAAALGAALIHVAVVEWSGPMLERVSVSFERLPPAFDGMTVAVVADVHAGMFRKEAAVRDVVSVVNSADADLVVLLGDIVHRCREASRYLPLLAGIRSREGVWACLGNHEYGVLWYSKHRRPQAVPSVEEWRRMYADAGAQLLVNEARCLTRGASRLWLVGVGDAYSGRDDVAAALDGLGDEECRIVITHSPDAVDHPRMAGVDLVLAGHTHGGQVWLPLVGPLYASCRGGRERAAGLSHANGTILYVTRGAGEGLPLRIGCPREVTLMTLRRGPRA